jgi:hypothetical protein
MKTFRQWLKMREATQADFDKDFTDLMTEPPTPTPQGPTNPTPNFAANAMVKNPWGSKILSAAMNNPSIVNAIMKAQQKFTPAPPAAPTALTPAGLGVTGGTAGIPGR